MRGFTWDEIFYTFRQYSIIRALCLYGGIFMAFSLRVGIEMPNWQDHLLWDYLLMNLAPQGRNVFGLNTSDTHKISDWMMRGHVWALMKDNTVDNLRECLESGAFFSAARYIYGAGEMARWNAQLGESWDENSWDADRSKPEPIITSIDAGNGKIMLTAVDYRAVQWISDGEVVAEGLQIDLAACENLGAYVRAAVLGTGGVLYTQPFLLDYAGKPMGKSVPKNYFDFGQVLAAFRWLLYPIAFVSDKIMRLRYCL